MPFAAALVGWKLARSPAWVSAKRPLLWATGLAVVAFLFFASVGVMVLAKQRQVRTRRAGGMAQPDRDCGL